MLLIFIIYVNIYCGYIRSYIFECPLQGLKWPPGAPINPDTIGRILLVDLNQPDPKPKEVTIKGDLDLSNFNPLGITKWINKKIGMYI